MNILVVGSGGREHALAWKLKQSARAGRVFVAPGNAGTAVDAENVAIRESDFPALIDFARQNKVGLTVVGPEGPLASGIVDAFQKEGLAIFGPSQAAAQIEASKVFCKEILKAGKVPTADYHVFRDAESAERFLFEREDMPWVIKADGLAAGKGVLVCSNRQQAMEAINQVARQKAFGKAGDRLIIEERLVGEEVSVLAITDGQTLLTLPAAQDHKPALDGDTGPNTGGMGAYCPAPVLDEAAFHWVEEQVLVPTIHAMNRAGRSFRGCLYAGLMITSQGPKVLEYNARFGDPETQPLLMRLQSDLVEIMLATVEGRLDRIAPLKWDPRPAVCVVMASAGYPGEYQKGFRIRGLDDAAGLAEVKVFHAGTAIQDGQPVTAGGRVLGVTGIGQSIAQAKLHAYTAVKRIRWDGAWCRKDISDKAFQRK